MSNGSVFDNPLVTVTLWNTMTMNNENWLYVFSRPGTVPRACMANVSLSPPHLRGLLCTVYKLIKQPTDIYSTDTNYVGTRMGDGNRQRKRKTSFWPCGSFWCEIISWATEVISNTDILGSVALEAQDIARKKPHFPTRFWDILVSVLVSCRQMDHYRELCL